MAAAANNAGMAPECSGAGLFLLLIQLELFFGKLESSRQFCQHVCAIAACAEYEILLQPLNAVRHHKFHRH
jgi:hypothetical protein